MGEPVKTILVLGNHRKYFLFPATRLDIYALRQGIALFRQTNKNRRQVNITYWC